MNPADSDRHSACQTEPRASRTEIDKAPLLRAKGRKRSMPQHNSCINATPDAGCRDVPSRETLAATSDEAIAHAAMAEFARDIVPDRTRSAMKHPVVGPTGGPMINECRQTGNRIKIHRRGSSASTAMQICRKCSDTMVSGRGAVNKRIGPAIMDEGGRAVGLSGKDEPTDGSPRWTNPELGLVGRPVEMNVTKCYAIFTARASFPVWCSDPRAPSRHGCALWRHSFTVNGYRGVPSRVRVPAEKRPDPVLLMRWSPV